MNETRQHKTDEMNATDAGDERRQTQQMKRDRRRRDAGDRQTQEMDRRIRWTDAQDERRRWTQEMDAGDGYKEGKGLRRVRGNREGNKPTSRRGENKRRERVNR